MNSNMKASPEHQLQDRISRIAEGVLMLGGALAGIWLLSVMAISFIK